MLFVFPQARGSVPCHRSTSAPQRRPSQGRQVRGVMPRMQEEAAERVDVAPRAAINRRTKDIEQPFGGKSQSANQPSKLEKCSQYLSRFSSAVEQRFCKPKVGSSILSTGTSKNKYLADTSAAERRAVFAGITTAGAAADPIEAPSRACRRSALPKRPQLAEIETVSQSKRASRLRNWHSDCRDKPKPGD